MHVHAARGSIPLAPKKDPRAHYREYACFQDKLGTYTGGIVDLVFKHDAVPVFRNACRVPFPRLQQVQAELGSYSILPVYRSGSQNADADNLSRLIPPSYKVDTEIFS